VDSSEEHHKIRCEERRFQDFVVVLQAVGNGFVSKREGVLQRLDGANRSKLVALLLNLCAQTQDESD